MAPHIFGGFWQSAAQGAGQAGWQLKPFHGESFLATLPPELCRADDEALQQAARALVEGRSRVPSRRQAPAGRPDVAADAVSELVARSLLMEAERTRLFTQSALQGGGLDTASAGAKFIGAIAPEMWKQIRRTPRTVPDFSATELELLATCPFKFYLQRVLRLETLQTNEMEATPLALGSLVHRVMHHALLLLRGDAPPADAPAALAGIRRRFADLCRPAYAVQKKDGAWHISASGPGRPVVQLEELKLERYLELVTAVADAELDAEEQSLAGMMLGAIEQRGVVRTNLVAGCCNLLRVSLQPAEFGNVTAMPLRRFPALLEFAFGAGCEKSAVSFVHPDDPVNRLQVHGKLDRVDLLADAEGVVRAMTVVDYKGKSKSALKPEKLAEEIAAARDCQLPVYGLVAQAAFGDALPLTLQYQPYRGDLTDILKAVAKNWITLDGEPVGTDTLDELTGAPGAKLMTVFARRIFQCLEILESGAFVAQPQECGHCEFRGCCRYTAPALEAEEQSME
jgi:hypothetical protein